MVRCGCDLPEEEARGVYWRSWTQPFSYAERRLRVGPLEVDATELDAASTPGLDTAPLGLDVTPPPGPDVAELDAEESGVNKCSAMLIPVDSLVPRSEVNSGVPIAAWSRSKPGTVQISVFTVRIGRGWARRLGLFSDAIGDRHRVRQRHRVLNSAH